MKDRNNMDTIGLIVILIVISALAIIGVLLALRIREHATTMYERRMSANAHLVSMVKDQRGMKITIYRDGSMALDTSANAPANETPTPQTPRPITQSQSSAVDVDAAALAEAARIVKTSLSDQSLAAKNQIIPAGRWSSAEMWQRAIDALRARGWLMDIAAAGQRGTFVASGLTLADLLERISLARRQVVLESAVAALPPAQHGNGHERD